MEILKSRSLDSFRFSGYACRDTNSNSLSRDRFGFDSPLFINLVRDPVERIISDYYYRRSVAKKNIESYNVTPSKFWLEKVSFESCQIFRVASPRNSPRVSLSDVYFAFQPLEECIRRGDDECRYMTGYLQVGHMVPYFCGHHQKCMWVLSNEMMLM